jgi:hypothetical protein
MTASRRRALDTSRTNYTVQDAALQGASLGGSVTWFNETFGGTPLIVVPVTAATPNGRSISSVVRQPSYAVVDLRAGYKVNKRLSLSVNVNNVLDKTYYARISLTGRRNYYGVPRTVFATLRSAYPWSRGSVDEPVRGDGDWTTGHPAAKRAASVHHRWRSEEVRSTPGMSLFK